jgi:hypothetical protein
LATTARPAPVSAERLARCDDADGVADADIDGTWLIGDFVDFSVDPGAVDGAEADAPETGVAINEILMRSTQQQY